MRIDGRKSDEIRQIKITRNYLKHPEGSVLIEIGETKVICTASIEERLPPFLRGKGKGWVTAEYAMLPRSTELRMLRDGTRGRINGRSHEIQRLIGRSLRCVVDPKALGERTIWIDCDVIQADGGTRTAAITGAFIALADALAHLCREKKIKRMPVNDFLAATSAGIVDGELLLDLCFAEDSEAEIDLNLVMTGSGAIVEIQGTAEKAPCSREQLDRLLDVASSGVMQIINLQRQTLSDLAEEIEKGKKNAQVSSGNA